MEPLFSARFWVWTGIACAGAGILATIIGDWSGSVAGFLSAGVCIMLATWED